MDYRRLGRTDVKVSALCLGSMTWGSQNNEAEAHAQIDHALDYGVNFIDTAEMYPTTPHRRETCGDSERLIGSWLAKSPGRRGNVVLATKVIGDGYKNIRDGGPITPESIEIALHDSLEKLQTDYIDLYQLHWPNRGSYHFRRHWAYDPSGQDTAAILADLEATFQALDGYVKAGKIRHIGLSNDTAWGVMRCLGLSERLGLPRVVSVQNEYNLMKRLYDTDLAELSHHEEIGLLAFSPLAAGMLTGKYANGARPPGSRATINEDLSGRMNPIGLSAADAYADLARKHGLDPAQMALAFCLERPFMTSAIFGATSPAQLENCLKSAELTLSDAVKDDILALYRQFPAPY